MTLVGAIRSRPVTSVNVSPATYAALIHALDSRHANLCPSTTAASYMGVDILVDKSVPDGMVALFHGHSFEGMVTLEHTPANPIAQTAPAITQVAPAIAHVEPDPDMPGTWKAYDRDGQFLWHITDKGAKDYIARQEF